MDWLNGVFALGGVLIAVIVEEFRRQQERSERFRTMTFEKRLQAHQKAYYFLIKFTTTFNYADQSELLKIVSNAEEWWDGNCLYLDTESRKQFGVLPKIIRNCVAHPEDTDLKKKLQLGVLDTNKAIVKGIGMEYLPN